MLPQRYAVIWMASPVFTQLTNKYVLVACSSETPLMFYQATRRDNSKDGDLQGCYSVKIDWNCCLLRNLARHRSKLAAIFEHLQKY